MSYDEGLCVQYQQVGPYDEEPATVAIMLGHMERQGYALDITDRRHHHEIYLSDARKASRQKLRPSSGIPSGKHDGARLPRPGFRLTAAPPLFNLCNPPCHDCAYGL